MTHTWYKYNTHTNTIGGQHAEFLHVPANGNTKLLKVPEKQKSSVRRNLKQSIFVLTTEATQTEQTILLPLFKCHNSNSCSVCCFFYSPLLPTGAKCIHWRCTIWLFPICASILPVYGNPIVREAVCDVMVLHTATVRVEGGVGGNREIY